MDRTTRTLPVEELARQHGFCDRVKLRWADRLNRQPRACVMTYGCQQNEADSELIRGMLIDMGCTLTEDENEADLVLLNTCAIREHAEMRVFGNIGALSHAKRRNPNLIIALCGCMAQQQSIVDKVKKSYPYVSLVFGTHALYRFPELLCGVLEGKKRVYDIEGDEAGVILEGLAPVRKEGTKAWLSIMYGCNNFCAYCIVPYVRGRERSRTPEAVIAEFKHLVAQGYQDITLLGQNVNSYGNDLGGACDFAELLERINAVPGEFRVRFMTSHPKDCTKRLLDVMARCDKVCKAIHLPVQSGSDRILQAMNRRYTAAQYLALVDYARAVMPEVVFTSDIIVGFPGETEEDFEQTLALIEKVRFLSLFTFLYSPRGGTVAATLPDSVPEEEKKRWFDRLLAAQNRISREENEVLIGQSVRVLVDGKSDDARFPLTSRTEGFRLVLLEGDEALIGRYVEAEITQASTWSLFGKVK